jgi:hypothetical protein
MGNRITLAKVRTDVTELDPSQAPLELALFDEDGAPLVIPSSTPVEPVEIELIDTPDASDPETTETLANANKAKINELLGVLADLGFVTIAE